MKNENELKLYLERFVSKNNLKFDNDTENICINFDCNNFKSQKLIIFFDNSNSTKKDILSYIGEISYSVTSKTFDNIDNFIKYIISIFNAILIDLNSLKINSFINFKRSEILIN